MRQYIIPVVSDNAVTILGGMVEVMKGPTTNVGMISASIYFLSDNFLKTKVAV